MPRISVVEENQAQGIVKEFYDGIRSSLGFVPNLLKLPSTRPQLFEPWMRYFQALMFTPSELPQDQKEKVATAVSQANRCSYCVKHHVNFQKMYGVDDAIARQVGDDFEQADLPEREKALLRYAVRVGRDSTKVTDADVETLRNHGYTDGQILEATLVVAHFSGLNRLADALGVEFDDNIA